MRKTSFVRSALLCLAALLLALGAAACDGWPRPRPVDLSEPVRDRLRNGTYAVRYVVVVRRPASRSAPARGAPLSRADADPAAPAVRRGEAHAADTARPPRTYDPRDDQGRQPDPADSLANFVEAQGGKVRHRFTAALYGFSAALPDSVVARLLREPAVVSVTPVVRGTTAGEVQPLPPWGLDRIDQADSVLDKQYVYGRTGAGVNVYVLDTGIHAIHADFGGRRDTWVAGLYSVVRRHGDDAGHGTHVAATIAGTTYGVAKQARLWSVRVSRTELFASDDLIRGIDEAIRHGMRPAVINISLIGPADGPTDLAVAAAADSGITVVTAAGNYTTATATGTKFSDACSYSPAQAAQAAQAITVAGSKRADELYSQTGVGPCVDLFAPAVGILSAGIDGDTDADFRNGTSMAAAHVTGAVALYLEANPAATPAQVAMHLLTCTALQDRLVGVPTGTVNRLVFTGTPAATAAGCVTPPPS